AGGGVTRLRADGASARQAPVSAVRADGVPAGQAPVSAVRAEGATAGQAAVALERVTKSFDDHKVLDEVSFDVAAGRAFCLLGRSGTGKSVTLRHIIGLVRPDSGKVYVEGRDITGLDPRGLSDVRKRMGFLFQNAALFDSMTVGDNVAFPMRRHSDWPDDEI